MSERIHLIVLFIVAAFGLSIGAINGAEPQTGEAIVPTGEEVLDKLDSNHLRSMDRQAVESIYASRMSSPGPGNPWVPIVDADISARAEAQSILSALLANPSHRGIRPNVWGWLAEHPSFAGTKALFAESLDIYRRESQNFSWEERAAFAELISAAGTVTERPIIEELAKNGGLPKLSKTRYDKRLAAEKASVRAVFGEPDRESSSASSHPLQIGANPQRLNEGSLRIALLWWLVGAAVFISTIGMWRKRKE